MAWTQENIDNLEQAIAEGAKVVQYGDKRVEYHSLKEMQTALKMMKDSLLPPTAKPTRIYAYTSKGTE